MANDPLDYEKDPPQANREPEEPVVPSPYASLTSRAMAVIIDSVVYIVIMLIAANVSDVLKSFGEELPNWIKMAIFGGILFVYEPILVVVGCTLGQLMAGVRIRDERDFTRKLPVWRSYIRYIPKVLLGIISMIFAAASPAKQALHDLFASSVAITPDAAKRGGSKEPFED